MAAAAFESASISFDAWCTALPTAKTRMAATMMPPTKSTPSPMRKALRQPFMPLCGGPGGT